MTITITICSHAWKKIPYEQLLESQLKSILLVIISIVLLKINRIGLIFSRSYTENFIDSIVI